MEIINWLQSPWPWYVAGPVAGLTVPVLLILGNKKFGISSSLKHICAACIPANIPFFQYNWKNELWNLNFVAGIFIGGLIAALFLDNGEPMVIASKTMQDLRQLGINNFEGMMPSQIFSWEGFFTIRGSIFVIIGGFLVGFGTRYAGGCTSGHAIMGLSNLQGPSLVATICFMVGGIFMTHIALPYLLAL